ncbi:MAG: 50S ribosomal protein L35 [Opitutales bacterium]|nr:50S ribosomal protein L35 [Opitutales bacterium]
MNKTRKSIKKRFKVTGSGKLVRRTPGYRHMLRTKSTKARRRAGQDKLLPESHAKTLRNAITPGL